MALWMAWAVLVATLLGAAAHLTEAVLRGGGRAGRHVWASALAASLGLPVWTALRPPAPEVAAHAPGTLELPALLLVRGTEALPVVPTLAERAEPWLLGLWVLASALLALSLAGGLLRLSVRARRWPPATLDGSDVLLSDDFGPALLGLRRQHVVLPRWALALEPERLALVLLHEREHRRAGDARLLLASSAAVLLAPWNPALWWQLRRLRAAVELDCDARVLGRGASPAAYGALLLELGSRTPGHPLPFPVAALSQPETLLERRLKMVVRGTKRLGRTRTLLAAGVVALLVGVACEAPSPTVAPEGAEPERAGSDAVAPLELPTEVRASIGDAPLVYVDGVRVEGGIPDDLDPDRIERIEVVKGMAATRLFGAEAQHGVIQIFTKAGEGADEAAPAETHGRDLPLRQGKRPPDPTGAVRGGGKT